MEAHQQEEKKEGGGSVVKGRARNERIWFRIGGGRGEGEEWGVEDGLGKW